MILGLGFRSITFLYWNTSFYNDSNEFSSLSRPLKDIHFLLIIADLLKINNNLALLIKKNII